MTDIQKMFETLINNLTEEQKNSFIAIMSILSQPKTKETEKMLEILENTLEPSKTPVLNSKTAESKSSDTVPEILMPGEFAINKSARKSQIKKQSLESFTTIKQERKGKETVKFKKNSWQDTGEDRENDDLKTPRYEPTPRSREKSKKVEVECHICGKTFFEDPRYIYGEFLRCSKCGRR